MKKNILYSFTCLAFAVIIGGAIYEHMNVVPKWAAAPPVSLSMFQGEYGLNPELFWMLIHPVNLLLLTITLLLHWRSGRRKHLLTVLMGYIIILAVTAVFFVPELLSITKTAAAAVADADLTRRAGLWEVLSILRLGILVILSIVLFTGLTKPNQSNYAVHSGMKQ
jgi:hypothetical protein